MTNSKIKIPPKTYGYIRVSTDKQDVENQKHLIEQYCNAEGITVDQWYEDVISRSTKFEQRNSGFSIKNLKPNDTLIVSEMTRLGSNVFDLIDVLRDATERKYTIIFAQDRFKSTDETAELYVAVGGWFSKQQLKYIQQKTSQALQRKKAQGLNYCKNPPFGFKVVYDEKLKKDEKYKGSLVKDIGECLVLKDIFGLSSDLGAKRIATYLKAHGYKNRIGKPYNAQWIEKLLKRREFYEKEGII